jgi:phospholipase C
MKKEIPVSQTGTPGRTLKFLLLCAAVLVPLLISACSSSHTNGNGTPPSLTIAASPSTITAGGSAMLSVSASNATQVTITGTDGSSYTMAASGGTQKVTPSATTTYTATAIGTGGMTTANAVVTVSAGSAPTVIISANPATIAAGGSSTLTVTATNATQVTVTGTDGSSYTLSANGGTQSVSPSQTTTYTATATGAAGTAKATATVTVSSSAAPTVTIAANPTAIAEGSSSTLTVTATNATQVTVTGTDGSSYTLAATGGTQSVSPAQTTTYTATATGAAGTAKATAVVAVSTAAAPTITIAANPTTIAAGSSSTLTVTATNATQVTVTGTDGSSYTLSPTGGTQSVSPAQTTTYIATASGAGGTAQANATVTVSAPPATTVSITANPTTIVEGSSSTLTVTATNATQVTVTGTDGSSYTLSPTGGSQSVSPSQTTTYTATATSASGNVTATVTVNVTPGGNVNAIQHVVFMLQENHSFDNYFGMLNTYRHANSYNLGDDGNDYEVDGLVDYDASGNKIVDLTQTVSNEDDEGASYTLFKFKSTCVDDMSSDWLSSFGDVNRYDFLTTRPINMDGFVHDAEGYANSCASSHTCSGTFSDLTGQRSMGYYDDSIFNYYYYMASQFAVSDRWFSPVASKSIDNRIATFTGGTTQGLVKDPGGNDHLSQLSINSIFKELDQAGVSWKIYFTVTEGLCTNPDDCPTTGTSRFPATDFLNLSYSTHYIYNNPSGAPCTAPTQPSSVVGDSTNSYCIDPTHIAPLGTPSNPPPYSYFADLANSALPSFSFIEAGYGHNDEHPGSGQSVIFGQVQVASIINAFMSSSAWPTSVFFLSYDEGGGPYDHVPPVPGYSNKNTNAALGSYPDIRSIAVNPDSNPNYFPCVPLGGTPTTHCDLVSTDPGANPGDAAAQQGFGAQLGFRLPNFVVSPFTRRHYVSHIPMDHTAVIRFVETRFIGPNATPLTARDAAQPNLLDFFDFTNVPWETPPTPPAPTPTSDAGPTCTPQNMGP